MSLRTRYVAVCTLAALVIATPVALGVEKPVKPTLSEYRIRLDRAHMAHGPAMFDLRNSGKLQHEFVLVKTARRANALPVKNGAVSRHGWKAALPLEPGERRRLVYNNVRAGHYVLICGIKGHYQEGMRRDFTVR